MGFNENFTLVKVYSLSVSLISWEMVLIGDPLYQPFRSRGGLRTEIK